MSQNVKNNHPRTFVSIFNIIYHSSLLLLVNDRTSCLIDFNYIFWWSHNWYSIYSLPCVISILRNHFPIVVHLTYCYWLLLFSTYLRNIDALIYVGLSYLSKTEVYELTMWYCHSITKYLIFVYISSNYHIWLVLITWQGRNQKQLPQHNPIHLNNFYTNSLF